MKKSPAKSSGTTGDLFPDDAAAAPVKRAAAKKAAAKKTAVKKTAAKKSAAKPTVVETAPEPAPPQPKATKKAAKPRVTTKTAATAAPEAVAPPPAPRVVEEKPVATKKVAKKAASRKKATPAVEEMVREAAIAGEAAHAPREERQRDADLREESVRENVPQERPERREREPRAPRDSGEWRPGAARQAEAPGGENFPRQGDRRGREPRPERAPRGRGPRQDDRALRQDERVPRQDERAPREEQGAPDGGQGRPPQGEGPQFPVPLGPDGQPRRLTKWERWKIRKEKFKLLKQQRYLERMGGKPPGANGEAPQGDRPERQDRGPRPERGERMERPERQEPVLGPPEDCAGLLEMTGKGFAYLRPAGRGYDASPSDPFVSPELIRSCGLREGVMIDGVMRRGSRGYQVTEIKSVNDLAPEAYRTLPLFEELTAINPNKRYMLETVPSRYTTRLIDFIAPIGRGQRGLIVAPPRAGKTTFLQHIAEAMLENYDEIKVMVVLVDERPEEVTEIARAVPGAEIMASSNDQDPRNHIRMAHLAIERAKRLVEAGQHVFIVLDSITRLARAFNAAVRGGGKAMSGGVDSRALEGPRKLFASARNTREAGSLTIIATALVETNNKGDDLVFQEFKGTGNMELVLDRKIAQQYVYPAVDIFRSGTRREELLMPGHQMDKVHLIRRGLSGHKPVEAVERLMHFMKRFPNNAQMLMEIKQRE